jgi:2'-5' RNA ligase
MEKYDGETKKFMAHTTLAFRKEPKNQQQRCIYCIKA